MNLFRRAGTSMLQYFRGESGESVIDTDKNTLVVFDGTTPGGHPLAKERHPLSSHSDVSINDYYDGYYAQNGSVLTFNGALNKWVPQMSSGGGSSATHYRFQTRDGATPRMDGGNSNAGNEWSWSISQPWGTSSSVLPAEFSESFNWQTDAIKNFTGTSVSLRVTLSYEIYAVSGAFPSGLVGVRSTLRTSSGLSPFGIPGSGSKKHTFDTTAALSWSAPGTGMFGMNVIDSAAFTDVFDIQLSDQDQFIPVIYVYNEAAFQNNESATNTWIARGSITVDKIV